MSALSCTVVKGINADDHSGVTACWHDESHLNRYLSVCSPAVVLSPSYCMPDDASGYPWLSGMERTIVAVDKTAEERGAR